MIGVLVVLPYILIIAAVLVIAVALRLFAGPDEPGSGITHYQEGERDGGSDPDEKPPDADGPDDLLIAA